MKATHLAVAVALLVFAGCSEPEYPPAYFYDDVYYPAQQPHQLTEADYADPGELALRDEILTLPFKHEEWMYRYPNDLICRVTIGFEHLFLETPDHKIIAIDRRNGRTSWKHFVHTGKPINWRIVESFGVPEEVDYLEKALWQNKRDLDQVIAEKGPGKESEPLRKKRKEFHERLRVAKEQDNIYFLSQHWIFCLERRSGARKWKRKLNFVPGGQPFAIRNFVFIPGQDLVRVWMLDVEERGNDVAYFKSALRGDGKNHIMNQPVFNDPTLFFVCHDGKVYAHDVVARKLKWTFPTERTLRCDPLLYHYREVMLDP
ncbi:MAG: outer membrane protein assembly factor BamB family protein, partial [Planctomycetota bacterium]